MEYAEVLLVGVILLYSAAAPFTKVEESFNLQAIHDITNFWPLPSSLDKFDHFEFPGVVPRSFIGALVISILAYPFNALTRALVLGSGRGALQQFITRAVVGLINAACLIVMKRAVVKAYGSITGNFFLALQATQFHLIYYASRTLPNILALPLTSLATAYIVDPVGNLYHAVFIMAVAATILRAEIAVLLLTTVAYHLFITNRLGITKTLRIGLRGTGLGLLLSFFIDSYFWRLRLIPEVSSFLYNVVHGKAVNWGVSPLWQYALDVPRLLLNPLASTLLIPIALRYHQLQSLHLLVPALAFIGIYSLQAHKEWRFIIYIVPQLTIVAASGASYVYTHRQKSAVVKILNMLVFASIMSTGLLSAGMLAVSQHNYPGANAILSLEDGANTYLDVLTCMTGASRFLQAGGTFYKSEDPGVLRDVNFWENLDYASVADPNIINQVYSTHNYESSDSQDLKTNGWMLHKDIEAFSGLLPLSQIVAHFPPQLFKYETKLYVMKNTVRPPIEDFRDRRNAQLYAEWAKAQEDYAAEDAVAGVQSESGERHWYSWVLDILKQALMFF